MSGAAIGGAAVLGPTAIGWVIEALIASSVLMALVLVARGAVRRAFGPQVGYALWALPALRLALPPLPEGWRERVAMPIGRAGEAVTVLVMPVDAAAPVAPFAGTAVAGTAPGMAAALPWGIILGVAWALGALGFFAFNLWRHRRFCARLLGEARLLDRVDGIRVIETPAASGPLAFGIARRFVAFPRDFADRYDPHERELALAHELGHHARGDLLANWAALGVLALHWFNPLAWRAFRAFRCDQELANDARVLAGRSRTDRHIYACAIVKAAHGGAISAACHLHTIADLKGRLTMLTNTRMSRTRLAGGAATVLGLVAGGLVTTASGSPAAAAVSRTIGGAAGVELATPAAPAAPEAPAVPAAPAAPQAAAAPAATTAPTAPAAPRAPARPEPSGIVAPPAVPSVPAAPAAVTVVAGGDAQGYRIVTTGPGRRAMIVPIPEVVKRSCNDGPDGGARQLVVQRGDGDRRVMIVCTNRIQRAAAEGAATAANSATIEADALRHAAEGLRTARMSIAASPDLSDAERTQALAGITQAEAELADRRDAGVHRD